MLNEVSIVFKTLSKMACFVVFVWQSSQLPEQKEGLLKLPKIAVD